MTFPDDVVAAVLHHMNDDHHEDNQLIARAFGHPDATSAVMVGVDGVAGYWSYEVGGSPKDLTVPWSAPISERVEIRREVVVVYRAACDRLGIEPRQH